ncbi:MAG: ATP-binding protein [Candidatus Eisenbacteria bacterium]|nr:ATP-binding protein [Candidatus Eisenbacteria bacterium]
MDPRFLPHNTHRDSVGGFSKRDPNLRQLVKLPLPFRSPLLDRLKLIGPGIYSLTGGRQIGKTTVLKQWMAELLASGTAPERIYYLAGELIDDHHTLVRLITDQVAEWEGRGPGYLLVDEVTYIREWDKGVKFLADAGTLEDLVLMVSGSDSTLIQEARMRFPGRRGTSSIVDFHIDPLTFREYVNLAKRIPKGGRQSLLGPKSGIKKSTRALLDAEFARYLAHGGFLRAINDMAQDDAILPSTFATYGDWIRGDMLKRGKQEHYLREVLTAVATRYGTQVTWNALAKDLSIDHPTTVADYVALLTSMDAVFVQAALLEDKLAAAPRKARRVMFADPFILHAVNSWLRPDPDPFRNRLGPLLDDPVWFGKVAEACAVTHLERLHPTFYIKAEGEVDIAYVEGKRFHPIEVKWTQQLRPKDLKQIAKYRNGRIWARSWDTEEISGIPVDPLALALYRLGNAVRG